MERALEFVFRAYAAARERADSLVVGWAMAVVTFGAGFISYTHICALVETQGQNWKTAHILPTVVDGQIVVGSAYFMYGGTRWQKFWGVAIGVAPGVAESLYANWASGIAHGLVAAGVATVPAQAFACSTILFERWLHRRKLARIAAGELRTEAERRVAEVEGELEQANAAHDALAGRLAVAEARYAGTQEANSQLRARVVELEAQLRRRPARRQPAAPGAAPQGTGQEAADAAPALPADGDARLELPSGALLAALLDGPLSSREIEAAYQVGRFKVNTLRRERREGTAGPWDEPAGQEEQEEVASDAA